MTWLLTGTEIGMIAYWIFASLVALEVMSIDPSLMYSDYENPVIVAWNWSFLPIDVLFAVCGLSARFWISSPIRKEVVAVIGLTLMFCAGVMAITFWLILNWFDVTWWGVNIWLMILASVALFQKWRAVR